MVAGLPGSGIGGCFFLLSALLMPLVELVRTFQGRSTVQRWRFVMKQWTIAAGVLGMMWATGWAIGWALFALAQHHPGVVSASALAPHNFLQAPPVFYTLATLLVVLLSVMALKRVVRVEHRRS